MMMMMLLTVVIILRRFLFSRWNLVVVDDVRGVDGRGRGGSEVCGQLVGDVVPTTSLMVMGSFGVWISFGWIGFRGSVGSGSNSVQVCVSSMSEVVLEAMVSQVRVNSVHRNLVVIVAGFSFDLIMGMYNMFGCYCC
ncbi:hypothetical protein Hanom_Chr13g01231111 [Helianthus anomalus]